MTLVATWFNNENAQLPSVWTVSDTKISFEQGGTLEGNKIFELNVVCKNISREPGRIHYRSILTFAYAGSSRLAINTYATLNTILSNLGGGNDANPLRPDCQSILNTALAILKTHNQSIQTFAQIVISGVCPKSGRLFIGKVTAQMEKGIIDYTASTEFNNPNQFNYILAGSHIDEIHAVINNRLSIKDSLSRNAYWRLPMLVLSELISNRTYEAIGGNLQLATIHYPGISQLYAAVPEISDNETMVAKYQNIDTSEQIGRFVGECYIAIPAMIINIDSVDAWAKSRWPDKFKNDA